MVLQRMNFISYALQKSNRLAEENNCIELFNYYKKFNTL